MALAADRVRLAHKHRTAHKHRAADKLKAVGRLRVAHRLRLRLRQLKSRLLRPNPEILLTGATMVPTTFLSDRLVNL